MTTKVVDNPAYFITDQTVNRKVLFANVVYEAEVENLDFTPSDECVNLKFVNQADIEGMNVFPSVTKLAAMFNPQNH